MTALGYPDLIVNGSALGNPFVGQGAYTARLIQGLERFARDQFLIVFPEGGEAPSIPAKSLVRSSNRYAPPQAFLSHIIANDRLVRFVAREFPDAVFHSPGPIASRGRVRRTVVTLHDCIYRTFPNYLGRFLIRSLYMRATERFAAKATLVLTDSEFSKKELVEKAGISQTKIEVLYPWVSPEFEATIPPQKAIDLKARLKLPDRFWLYLGGYDYRKNVEFLVETYAQAQRSRKLPPLVLAGNIPNKSRVTCDVFGALDRSGLHSECILFPGLIPVEDLPTLYRAASLLIYPSLMEGFGLPPAEAMAVGTPVLASNTSSLPEVVKKPDCLFDPENRQSLVEKLLIAAVESEGRFSAELSPMFTEIQAIPRYLRLIQEVTQKN